MIPFACVISSFFLFLFFLGSGRDAIIYIYRIGGSASTIIKKLKKKDTVYRGTVEYINYIERLVLVV